MDCNKRDRGRGRGSQGGGGGKCANCPLTAAQSQPGLPSPVQISMFSPVINWAHFYDWELHYIQIILSSTSSCSILFNHLVRSAYFSPWIFLLIILRLCIWISDQWRKSVPNLYIHVWANFSLLVSLVTFFLMLPLFPLDWWQFICQLFHLPPRLRSNRHKTDNSAFFVTFDLNWHAVKDHGAKTRLIRLLKSVGIFMCCRR